MTHQHELLPLASVDSVRNGEAARNVAVPDSPAAPGPHTLPSEALEQWRAVQAKFVDESRGSVADARTLVDDLIQQVVRRLAEQRASLELQWLVPSTKSVVEGTERARRLRSGRCRERRCPNHWTLVAGAWWGDARGRFVVRRRPRVSCRGTRGANVADLFDESLAKVGSATRALEL